MATDETINRFLMLVPKIRKRAEQEIRQMHIDGHTIIKQGIVEHRQLLARRIPHKRDYPRVCGCSSQRK